MLRELALTFYKFSSRRVSSHLLASLPHCLPPEEGIFLRILAQESSLHRVHFLRVQYSQTDMNVYQTEKEEELN